MPELLIVDTDILIDVGRNVEIAVERLITEEQHAPSLAISVITKMELIVGCRNKKELKVLDGFLQRFKLINLDERIAEQAVELLRKYRLSHGLMIPDSLIAATALILESPLLSKNQKDYKFIDELELLPYP